MKVDLLSKASGLSDERQSRPLSVCDGKGLTSTLPFLCMTSALRCGTEISIASVAGLSPLWPVKWTNQSPYRIKVSGLRIP